MFSQDLSKKGNYDTLIIYIFISFFLCELAISKPSNRILHSRKWGIGQIIFEYNDPQRQSYGGLFYAHIWNIPIYSLMFST